MGDASGTRADALVVYPSSLVMGRDENIMGDAPSSLRNGCHFTYYTSFVMYRGSYTMSVPQYTVDPWLHIMSIGPLDRRACRYMVYAYGDMETGRSFQCAMRGLDALVVLARSNGDT
jgi:hypothetical protein